MGRKHTEEAKKKIGAWASAHLPRARVEYLDPQGRLFKFRSRLERYFAEWMDQHGIAWDYEPDTLLLSDGRHYTPDFRLRDRLYIEVKHPRWLTRLDKVQLAQEDGHNVQLVFSLTDLESALAIKETIS